MTDHPLSSSVQHVLPTGPERRPGGRRAPAAALAVVTAVALGAGVLLLPAGAPDAADGLVTTAAVQRVGHPSPPEARHEAPAPPPPVARVRDPFEPLIRDDGPATSAPGAVPAVSTPAADTTTAGAPAGPTTTVVEEVRATQAPPVSVPAVPSDGAAGTDQLRELALMSVEAAEDRFVAVLTLDGERLRAEVGDSFGSRADLLLLSLQQGPGDRQWTAVVQVGQDEPIDLVTGAAIRIP